MSTKPALLIVCSMLALGAAAPSPTKPEPPAPRVAEGNGAPWLIVEDRQAVPSRFHGAGLGKQALDAGTAKARSLATADFDENGVPDVVAGYASGGSGLFVLHRGNVDAVYPNAPEAQERKKAGTFTGAAFLPDADVFDAPGRADFIGAGDFDADGHWDVVTAARGGEALWLHLGDGKGGFGDAEEIALPGRVTAFVTGEINRRDGLTDIVVGVTDASGPRALVFEGPDGALRREPEVLMLASPATDFVLERLDDGPMLDLAVAAGESLVVVKGRDRKLSYELPKGMTPPGPAEIDLIDLPFEIETLAVGDFDGDREKELALLDSDGALHIKPAKEASRFAEETPADRIGTPASVAWKGTKRPAVTEQRRGRLVPVRMSTLPGDDLVLLDRPGRKLHVRLASGERPGGPNAREAREAAGTWASQELPMPGAAVLPMRLNSDALTDLAILSESASGLEAFEPGIESFITVTNTNDSGAGSLRDAIDQANALAGADTIEFNIPGAGPHVIQPLSNLPLITDAVTIDGTTQLGYAGTPVIGLDGALGGSGSTALRTSGGNNTFRALVINQFDGGAGGAGTAGISLFGFGNDFIESCFFGTDPSGTLSKPNTGVAISIHADGASVGGTTSAARNVISGAMTPLGAVLVTSSDSVVVRGNYIGTSSSGLSAIPNGGSGIDLFSSSTNVTIGGTTAGSGNVIAASGGGKAQISGGDSASTLIQGNLIGLAADGATPLACGSPGCIGVSTEFQTNMLVGGTTAAARNIISGNSDNGIEGGSSSFTVQGNYIGTDSTGAVAVGNFQGISTGGNAVIGGTAAGARNLISGNLDAGVWPGSSSIVQGNLIGTSLSGTSALPNGTFGVQMVGDGSLLGGSAAGARNVISGNTDAGVEIWGIVGANGNTLEGNFIGTDITGTLPLGNPIGVRIELGAHENSIGVGLAHPNVISGNGVGVEIAGGPATTSNLIEGNLIGPDVTGTVAIGNTYGVKIDSGATKNHVGVDSSRRNTISGNDVGVYIVDLPTAGNFVQGNFIGTDITGLTGLPNSMEGVSIEDSPLNVVGGSLPGERNVIAANGSSGLAIRGTGAANTLVHNNYIGTNATGEVTLGNLGPGLEISGSGGNLIGGPGPGDRNVLAGNIPNLWMQDVLASLGLAGNSFEGNYFGLSASGSTVLATSGSNVFWFTSDGTVFERNVIVGASLHGLRLAGVTGSQIRGNLIGMTPSFAAGANGGAGLWFVGPDNHDNFVGGSSDPEWNVVALNGQDGIRIDTGSVRNAISGNYIFDNGDLGIDLENDGVTPNDPGDPDTGANNRQNFPVITSATTTSGSVTVSGTIDSTPGTTFAVQVYRNMSCDPSGHGEGLERIGTVLAMTDGTGAGTFSGTFTASVPDTELLTALATDFGNGDTSEFSMCGTLTGVPPAALTAGEFVPGTPTVLSWPESPGTTMYHVYAGSAPTVSSVVSAPLDSCEVGTTTSTSFATLVTDIPPPGGMLWYLIRPEGPYGLGDVDEASSGPRSQDSIGPCGGSCAHDTCATGAALTSPCDPCVAMIVAADNFCTVSSWDSFCVSEVQSVCGSMRCPASQGTCAQPLCATGAALTPGCDVPPLASSCVADICAVDSFCCTTAWDGVCVNEVATICALGCL